MKKLSVLFLLIFMCLLPFSLQAQETVYYDAIAFPLFGKATDRTASTYSRLPSECEGVSRNPIWILGTNSTGLYIRFSSNSTSIHARWTSRRNVRMNHMCETGVRGLDLYALCDGQWRFAGSGRPTSQTSDVVIVKNMDGQSREYMLYLSLYDGVDSLEIGIDQGSVITAPQVDSPRSDRPVVAYGTSILQGGCASRAGMAHTAILSRRIDREVINFGFSGNAFFDYEIAELMASVPDPALFILDNVPNTSVQMIEEKGEKFFRILRDAHPDVPVIFVEDPPFPHMWLDSAIRKEITDKNAAQKALYLKLKSQGEKKIYYVGMEGMIGEDGEATVDGIHMTDLGMMRYVDHICPTVKKALKKAK